MGTCNTERGLAEDDQFSDYQTLRTLQTIICQNFPNRIFNVEEIGVATVDTVYRYSQRINKQLRNDLFYVDFQKPALEQRRT